MGSNPILPLINTDDTDSGNRSADTILYHYLFGEVPKLAEGTPPGKGAGR